MNGLGDISGVYFVVVGHLLVVVFKRIEETNELLRANREFLDQIALLKEPKRVVTLL